MLPSRGRRLSFAKPAEDLFGGGAFAVHWDAGAGAFGGESDGGEVAGGERGDGARMWPIQVSAPVEGRRTMGVAGGM
jgi:hypothetical protein